LIDLSTLNKYYDKWKRNEERNLRPDLMSIIAIYIRFLF
jgi:hypothetical protein